MQANYNVEIILVRTNQQFQMEVDPSLSFQDLFETVQECTKIPIVQPVFEIVNLNKIITDLSQQFGKLGLDKINVIKIKTYSQAEYNKLEEERKAQQQKFQKTEAIDKFLPPGEQTQQIQQDNRINLIFEIIDGNNKSVQTIKIDQNKTLNDAKEILLQQLGIIGQQRDAVDLILNQPNSENVFNPNKLGIELNKLQLENNSKIVCRFRYIGGK
ncbi:hypothetical protein pb186bvf_006247 [Paramecium bursaria]